MAAPTLSDYQQSNPSDRTAGSEVTASITWSSGDVIVVLGMSEDNGLTYGTPTATGLTFSALSGTPTNAASSCKGYAWSATAGSGGSSTVSAAKSDTLAGVLSAWVYSGSDGIGNSSASASLGTTTTQSLTRSQANSAVVQIWGDWNAVNDTTVTWTPSGETQRVAQFVSGSATFFVANWGDQGGTGSTAYGFSGFAGGDMTAVTVEVKGTAGGGGRTTKNTRSAPLGMEVGMNWRGNL